jgi:hypothetical protein
MTRITSTTRLHQPRLAAREKFQMYIVMVACRVGVICKSCGRPIEIDDQYIRGVRAVEMVPGFYGRTAQGLADPVNLAWSQVLSCGNSGCGRTHEYQDGDLRLYEE